MDRGVDDASFRRPAQASRTPHRCWVAWPGGLPSPAPAPAPCNQGLGCCLKGGKEGKAFDEAAHASAKSNTKLKYLVIDAAGNAHALKYFGLEERDVPALVVQNEDDLKFIKKNAAASDVDKFVSEYQVRMRPRAFSGSQSLSIGFPMAVGARVPLLSC